MLQNEIVKTTLKEWLSWKTDEYSHMGYVRIYVVPGSHRVLFLRHIKEEKVIRTGEKANIEYSILCEVPGSFSVHNAWITEEKEKEPVYYNHRDNVRKMQKEKGLFHFHSTDAMTIETLLELYQSKKGTDIRVEYYPINNSQYFDKAQLKGESFFMEFRTKNRVYRIGIDNTVFDEYNSLYALCDKGYTEEINKFLLPTVPDPVTSEGTPA